MIEKITCIECPNGCLLTVEVEEGKVVHVEGHKCEKGEKYASCEIEDPVRVLTSTVLTEGLQMRMVSVKTDGPIPKEKMMEAMGEVKKVRLNKSVCVGEVIIPCLLDSNVNLIATREAK